MKKSTKDMFGNEVKEGDLVKMYDKNLNPIVGKLKFADDVWEVQMINGSYLYYYPSEWMRLEPDPNLKPYIVWAAAILVGIILLVSFAL